MIDLKNTQQQKRYKILLIGDDCVDIYRYGTVDRISPEAPVPIFKLLYEEHRPGMAGNVKLNLEALGNEVTFISPDKVTTKTRLVDQRSKQHLIRIDEDVNASPITHHWIKNLDHYDAVVISDYNKGAVSYELISWIRENFAGPVFLDTKKTDLACFHGIFVKINELEYSRRVSINNQLIVTLGSKGAMYKTNRDPKHETFYTCPSVEVVDVTGAGDTFLAALTYKYLLSKDIGDSIDFAIKSSSVTVQHFGVYAPTLEEIQ